MEQRITENMGRSLNEHGYRDPVFVGKGSFAKVYRVRDEKRDFQACKISKVTEQWEQECRNSREITEGLQYLHERPHPFLYRDLKPENIRIRVDGRAGILDLGCLWNREQDWSGAGNRSFSAPEQFVPGEIPGEESDVYAVGRLLAVMLGDDTDGTVRQSVGIRRRNAEKRCGRKEQRQEKWLRKVIAMATCEERKDRIPEIKMLRTLLMVTDDSGRERKRACRAADFYYVRKLYCP